MLLSCSLSAALRAPSRSEPRASPTASAPTTSLPPAAMLPSPHRTLRLPFQTGSCRAAHHYPASRRAPTPTHTCLGRFLCDRLVGKHANPDLAAALDEPR